MTQHEMTVIRVLRGLDQRKGDVYWDRFGGGGCCSGSVVVPGRGVRIGVGNGVLKSR